MDVAGYAGVIKGFKSSDPNPIPFKAIVAATLVDRLRLVVTPSSQGKLRKVAFGLTFDDRRDVTQTVSRSKSGVVTFVAPLCERGATGPEASALLTATTTPLKVFANAGRNKPTTFKIAAVKVVCTINNQLGQLAGDVWGFENGVDTTTNTFRKPGEVASPVAAVKDLDEDEAKTEGLTRIHVPEVAYVWRSSQPNTRLGLPGRPTTGDEAFLPWQPIAKALYGDHHTGFAEYFGTDDACTIGTTQWKRGCTKIDAGWRAPAFWVAKSGGQAMQVGATHFQAHVYSQVESSSCAAGTCSFSGGFSKQTFVSAKFIASRLGFNKGKLRGYNLRLPTPHAQCAAALNAEAVCSGVARALELAPLSHGHERRRIASPLAAAISRAEWIAKPYGSHDLYDHGRLWAQEHGICGQPTAADAVDTMFHRERMCKVRPSIRV
jgi:hypothetical protein